MSKKNKLIFLLLMMVSNAANSSNPTGTIEKLIVGRLGHEVFIHLNNAPVTCGSDHPLGFNYAFSLKEHGAGKEILSVLLTAKASNRKITIQGEGTCNLTPQMEDVGYVYIY